MRLNKDIAAIIDEKILTLFEEQMDEIIDKIHTSSEDILEEFVLLTKLLVYSDKHRVYYFHKQHDLYDDESRTYAIKWLFFLAVLTILLCYILLNHDVTGWMRWITICIGSFMWVAVGEIYEHVSNWLKPCYKKRHEQWCFLVQKLYHRKEELLVELEGNNESITQILS